MESGSTIVCTYSLKNRFLLEISLPYISFYHFSTIMNSKLTYTSVELSVNDAINKFLIFLSRNQRLPGL